MKSELRGRQGLVEGEEPMKKSNTEQLGMRENESEKQISEISRGKERSITLNATHRARIRRESWTMGLVV